MNPLQEVEQEHEELLQVAIEAAQAVFVDKTVVLRIVRGSLEILLEEVQEFLDTLPDEN